MGEQMKVSRGTKFDKGKPRYDLLDYEMVDGVAQVMAFGAEKYDEHNWRGGIHWSRLFRSAVGHLISAFFKGWLDEESGLPHLDHAVCCIMFLRRYMSDPAYADLDDRYKPETKEI